MKKGFASAILAILLLQTGILALKTKNAVQESDAIALKQSLEIESAFFKRAEIENNMDFLIGQAMKNELRAKNLDAEKIKEKIITNILEYAKITEKTENAQSVEFFIENNGQKTRPSREALEKITAVFLANANGVTSAWFFFNAGEEKNTFFKAKITFGNFSNEFMFPKDYSVNVLGEMT